MELKFCDLCDHMHPKEWQQKHPKIPHICERTGKQVLHGMSHPYLPTPEWCPLKEKPNGSN